MDNNDNIVTEPAMAYGTSQVLMTMPLADMEYASSVAKQRGWHIVVLPQKAKRPIKETQRPSQTLCGIISLPKDFDYKKELSDALAEKYKL